MLLQSFKLEINAPMRPLISKKKHTLLKRSSESVYIYKDIPKS